MKCKKAIALGLASVMLIGTMATSTTVFAEDDLLGCGDVVSFEDEIPFENPLVENNDPAPTYDEVTEAVEDDDLTSIEDEFFPEETNDDEELDSELSELDIKREILKDSKKGMKLISDGLIDLMVKTYPTLTIFGGSFKAILSDVYGLGSNDPSTAILAKLDELKKQISDSEKAIKTHVGNVVAFDSIGAEFGALNSAISSMENKINDQKRQYQKNLITEEEMVKEIGDLYSSSEYNHLMNALSGTTNAFLGNTTFTLEQMSVFSSAFKLQSENNMFSGEVIDSITPYLLRQLSSYMHGYALIGEVLDNYELNKGIGKAEATRERMEQDIDNVLTRFNDFYSTDRYVFVYKGHSSIRLSRELLVKVNFAKGYVKYNCATPDFMSRNPLSASQVKDLADYAAEKGMTLFDFLFNKMQFTPVCYSKSEVAQFQKENKPYVQFVYHRTGMLDNSGDYILTGKPFVATGAQNLVHKEGMSYGRCARPRYTTMQAINANKKGAGDEKIELYYNGVKSDSGDMIFFQCA